MTNHKAAGALALAASIFAAGARAQNSTTPAPAGTHAATSQTKDQNIQAYINLLRSDVRQDKAEELGAVLQLNAADAAKFWPIYDEYDKELDKLNDMRVANIQDYARSYDGMTDEKADALIQKAMTYRKLRAELLAKYYGRVKQALGGIEAARFVMVEDQLLLIIDLQISSSLPLAN
jgi:hypothetical protein